MRGSTGGARRLVLLVIQYFIAEFLSIKGMLQTFAAVLRDAARQL